MILEKTAAQLLDRIKNLLNDDAMKKHNAMPDGCYFLDSKTVLCLPRGNGDARYPYSADGYNLWAHSSGYISINESTFYVVLSTDEGKEPYLNFYGGKLLPSGSYAPVSLLGIGSSPIEGNVERYVVYTPEAVYYLTETPEAQFCVRVFVSPDKKAYFSVSVKNTGKEPLKTYLSAYFNCFLMHSAGESIETKWFKQCKTQENGFVFYSVEDISRTLHLNNYGIINRTFSGKLPYLSSSTTSRSDYTGGKNNYLAAATPLFCGKFKKQKAATKFTETAVAGDLNLITLNEGESARIDYCLITAFDEAKALKAQQESVSAQQTDSALALLIEEANKKDSNDSMLKMTFEDSSNKHLSAETLEKFLGFVMRQVEFSALSKNSGVSLLGVRDVFQQLEAALMWNAAACKTKILEAFDFIGEDGRAPRQYSIPPTPDSIPAMDLRAFIDQGVWIINTVYRYIAYTGDYSILDEVCGYYSLNGIVKLSQKKDSVLAHLIKITEFLISNIDAQTGCLRALYGDWNDALDGMGVSLDKSADFGSGVSVMASLQLYGNLKEMKEILVAVGEEKTAWLDSAELILKNGLQKWGIEKAGQERRILHGWGDKRSYLVGSFKDTDGNDRVGLTSNAFWVLSGAYEWDKTIKADILKAYHKLDSKYGLRTFEPYFAPGTLGVGRIVNLPEGTAENCATYVHATLFGIWSLFEMGECDLAWEQLEKALPITHEHISTTQFIMSNSYSLNKEFEMDGESMSDWYTGSANVLIKVMTRCVFGADARLDGLHIRPCASYPFKKAAIRLKVCDAIVTINLKNEGNGKRQFVTNALEALVVNENELFFPATALKGNINIDVLD